MAHRWKPLEPDLEVVQIVKGASFTAWAHGLPFHTVRWHFHPEYEIHLVTHTTGQYFVGDFIGEFEPGQLVLTGPNLPHHWMSDGPVDQIVDERGIVVQFTEEFVRGAIGVFPELQPLQQVLEASRWGVLFPDTVASAAQPLLRELISARGARRAALFMQIMDILAGSATITTLAGRDYVPNPTDYLSSSMNSVLSHIAANPTAPGSEADLAAIAGKSRSAFSRAFKAHTGLTLVEFINRLRINFACQLLMTEPDRTVADICFEAGFNNLSNFNRRFLATKGMSPSQFRDSHPRSAGWRTR